MFLQQLLNHSLQVLGLWKVVCEHGFEFLSKSLSQDDHNVIKGKEQFLTNSVRWRIFLFSDIRSSNLPPWYCNVQSTAYPCLIMGLRVTQNEYSSLWIHTKKLLFWIFVLRLKKFEINNFGHPEPRTDIWTDRHDSWYT